MKKIKIILVGLLPLLLLVGCLEDYQELNTDPE